MVGSKSLFKIHLEHLAGLRQTHGLWEASNLCPAGHDMVYKRSLFSNICLWGKKPKGKVLTLENYGRLYIAANLLYSWKGAPSGINIKTLCKWNNVNQCSSDDNTVSGGIVQPNKIRTTHGKHACSVCDFPKPMSTKHKQQPAARTSISISINICINNSSSSSNNNNNNTNKNNSNNNNSNSNGSNKNSNKINKNKETNNKSTSTI